MQIKNAKLLLIGVMATLEPNLTLLMSDDTYDAAEINITTDRVTKHTAVVKLYKEGESVGQYTYAIDYHKRDAIAVIASLFTSIEPGPMLAVSSYGIYADADGAQFWLLDCCRTEETSTQPD
jgi:hypothetical protein